jgi:putative glutathione S-transferase
MPRPYLRVLGSYTGRYTEPDIFRGLWGYARDLYSLPAFRATTNSDHIKRHYYTTHPHINPARIVPDGPLPDWAAPHDRALS